MSISQIFGRFIHHHHRVKLTPEQEIQRMRERREQLRKSGFWTGTC